ncbi:YceH family protein [Bacteroidota bacterium]
MEFLTSEEERILGSLIEKKYTTPEYYPLTLNSIKYACNQKSNRLPVVNYTDEKIEEVIELLIEKKLLFKVSASEFRVTKYDENITRFFELTKPQIAVMCILMLRGPQTLGEIRSRSGRIYTFKDLREVEDVIGSLIKKESEHKLVKKFPRLSGREPRYACILSGEPKSEVKEKSGSTDENVQIEKFKKQIEKLRGDLLKLRTDFEKFKKQFE